VLVGFSQGGCVVAELLVRQPAVWAGAAILTGTLLGPDPAGRPIDVRLDGVPVALGLGSADPWLPVTAAEATRAALTGAGAHTELHVTNSARHIIHDADIALVTSLIDRFR
jgi:phospholipase/carboxylesterase